MDSKHLFYHENIFFCKKVFAFKNFLYLWKSFLIVGESPDCGKASWLWKIFLIVEKSQDCGKVFWSTGLLRNLGNICDSEPYNIALQLKAAIYCCIAVYHISLIVGWNL